MLNTYVCVLRSRDLIWWLLRYHTFFAFREEEGSKKSDAPITRGAANTYANSCKSVMWIVMLMCVYLVRPRLRSVSDALAGTHAKVDTFTHTLCKT